MSSPWIQTYSGIPFDLLAPTSEMVDIKDIAHSLARICRYTGHVIPNTYTVAEHSILVASLLPQHLKFQGLMHDAGECYTGDISSPMKQALGDVVKRIEGPINLAIAKKFSLPVKCDPLVKKADLYMLNFERRMLLGKCPREWDIPIINDFHDAYPKLTCLNAYEAEAEFMDHFRKLSIT